MIKLLTALFLAQASAAGAKYGILLMAHGGEPAWDKEISTIAKSLDAQAPTEVALGMADDTEIQKAIFKLEKRKVGKIVAVPLFINSSSEVMDQTRFVLGIGKDPSAVLKEAMAHMPHIMMPASHHHMYSETRVSTKLPLVMTSALDADPAVLKVLIERAKSLSKDPKKETLVLVGHGPVDDKANADWLKTMGTLADSVKSKLSFRDAQVATIRDDSPPWVKEKAIKDLRALVEEANKNGGTSVVVPYLIARGGIETHITDALKDLDYAWDGKTLCPHPAIVKWAGEVAVKGAKMDNMRVYIMEGGTK